MKGLFAKSLISVAEAVSTIFIPEVVAILSTYSEQIKRMIPFALIKN